MTSTDTTNTTHLNGDCTETSHQNHKTNKKTENEKVSFYNAITMPKGSTSIASLDNDKPEYEYETTVIFGTDSNQILAEHNIDFDDEQDIPPTQDEIATLRRTTDKIPWPAFSVVIVELFERFAYYGLTLPFQNYIQNSPGDDTPGYLGMGQTGATALNMFFQFFCYLTPLLGAIIADQYLGRYKTILLFSAVYIVGQAILVGTSIPSSSHTTKLVGLIFAMIIIGLGTGGIKSNVAPLMAEQYQKNNLFTRTLKSGERIIIDPAMTIQRLFMYFYFCINVGSLSLIATSMLEHKVEFWAAYALPFGVFFLAPAALLLCRKKYVLTKPTGSIILYAFQVIWIALRSNFNLEAAKPSKNTTSSYVSNWDDLFVDEVRRALVACKIFVFYPIYWVSYSQFSSNLVSMASTMNTNGTPNDILQNLDPITLIIFIPVMDFFVYPFLRRIGIKCRPISRITFGFFTAAIGMAYSAIIQHLVYSTGPYYKHVGQSGSYNDINVWIQLPSYFFIGLSEIFAAITGLEYAFSKAPPTMKSFVMGIFLLTSAFGSVLNIALTPTAKDPKLVWMYTGVSVACGLSGILFWLLFRKYNDTEDEMNALDAKNELMHVQSKTRAIRVKDEEEKS